MDIELDNTTGTPEPLCTVRLSRSSWATSRGIFTETRLIYLKKQCQGFNVLQEDACLVDPSCVVDRIINLHQCDDGVYQVITCNEHRDWESGHIDDYDYKLIPVVK